MTHQLRTGRGRFAAWALAAAWAGSPAFSAELPGAAEIVRITPELVKAAQREGVMSFRYSAQKDTTEYLVAEFSKQFPGTYVEGWGYAPAWAELVLSYNPERISSDKARALFAT